MISVLCLTKAFLGEFVRSHLLVVYVSACAVLVLFRDSSVAMYSKLVLTSVRFSPLGLEVFVQSVKYESILIHLHTNFQFDQHPLFKMQVFFFQCEFLASLTTTTTNQVSIGDWIYIWDFSLIPVINMSLFMLISCVFLKLVTWYYGLKSETVISCSIYFPANVFTHYRFSYPGCFVVPPKF